MSGSSNFHLSLCRETIRNVSTETQRTIHGGGYSVPSGASGIGGPGIKRMTLLDNLGYDKKVSWGIDCFLGITVHPCTQYLSQGFCYD